MAEIILKSNDEVLIQVKVKLSGSFLDMEKSIQDAVNDLGNTATQVGLEKFDTKGQPLKFGEVKMSSKGQVLKNYQTPYGVIGVARHVYQSAKGGATYCPLDDKARIITNTTPLFAKIISYKYANLSANEVVDDLSSNHRRNVTVNYIQNVADMIGGIAQATEETWDYDLPEQNEIVETVSASLDGTCVLMRDEGYREAMTGNVSLYNKQGDRLHTIYVAAAPEYGKEKFLTKLTSEIFKIKKQYPAAKYVGVADGAKSNWEFLEQHTEYQILDFYHATEYLADASYALYKKESDRRQWLNDACHQLKHDKNAANDLLKQLTDKQFNKLNKNLASKLKAAITYFTNQKHRMNYYEHMQQNLPIGSGVTEAACKVLVKQRLCHSGMKWKNQGASIVLSLRSLIKTDCRWEQFWDNINNDGINGIAA
jgi:hypothetical protein